MKSIDELKQTVENLKVLYVEDEKELHESVGNFLSKFFNHIDNAYNGKEGLELFEKQSYDIVISDLLMPILSGSEMIHIMQSKRPELFYAILTGTDLDAGKSLQCDFTIAKPMNIDSMLLMIEAIFNHTKEN